MLVILFSLHSAYIHICFWKNYCLIYGIFVLPTYCNLRMQNKLFLNMTVHWVWKKMVACVTNYNFTNLEIVINIKLNKNINELLHCHCKVLLFIFILFGVHYHLDDGISVSRNWGRAWWSKSVQEKTNGKTFEDMIFGNANIRSAYSQ